MISLIIYTLLLFVLELAYFKAAERFGIVDRPNSRSSHTQVTLRGGGVVFVLGVWLWALHSGAAHPLFLAGFTAVAVTSFIDDVHPLRNSIRLLVQFGSGALLLADLGLALPDGAGWLLVAAALVVGVGIVNMYNFMDGINGITGCYSLAVLAPLIWLNHSLHFVDPALLWVAALSAGVFLVFNFRRRARCFAGDVGSVSMAFIVVFAVARLVAATDDLSWLLLLSVYGADSVLTIIHRIMLHENLGDAHRKHAYQIMANELHLPHTAVASLYMVAQLAVSAGLILLHDHCWWYFTATLALLGAAYVAFMRRYYHLHAEYLKARLNAD